MLAAGAQRCHPALLAGRSHWGGGLGWRRGSNMPASLAAPLAPPLPPPPQRSRPFHGITSPPALSPPAPTRCCPGAQVEEVTLAAVKDIEQEIRKRREFERQMGSGAYDSDSDEDTPRARGVSCAQQ